MIDYLTKIEDLNKEKDVLRQVFNPEIELPNNLFVNSISIFQAFEFDLIYDPVFFMGLQSFIKKTSNENFTFYTLSPSPENYFFKYFSKYNVVKVPCDSSYDEYLTFLNDDPGNSPADSMIDNSQTVILFSNNPNWGIIGDKDREISIVGFRDINIRDMFLDSFEGRILFSSIRERAKVIDEMVDLDASGKKFYIDLERNYSPSVT